MKTINANPKQIDQQIAALQRQKETLEKLGKLQEQQRAIEQQMREVAKGVKGIKVANVATSTREFPRGVITFAATKVMLNHRAGATIDEIVNGILEKKKEFQLDESVTAEDLKGKVRNLLNSSERFQAVRKGSGVYKIAPNKAFTKTGGALAERLAKQVEVAA